MLKQITQQVVLQHQEVIEYAIKNDFLEVRFLNIGGAITKIALAEDDYKQNLVLNYQNLESYLNNDCFLNVLIGRTSNRITKGQLMLDGQNLQVDINSAPHNLHGGADNLTHATFIVSETAEGYALQTTLPHQPHGFPGNLTVTVYYELVDHHLRIRYEAVTDETTIVNLTQHAYFNLSGNLKRTIYDHELTIQAAQVAKVDDTSGFTEQFIPVVDTRFDFNQPRFIDPTGRPTHPLFDLTRGYDHLFLLDPQATHAVVFKDPHSGRTLKIKTSEPAMQFYAANHVNPSLLFEKGRQGEPHLGACFETHKVPFDYDSQRLQPGDTYRQETTFEFKVEKS
ncbi:MAG: galactose mutarotase [Defluviitaleaceae bacterium]|nr:galactose mutarotase [Defluviitaleaceae bacterium]